MASFNVSEHWAKFMAKQGFRVEDNDKDGLIGPGSRPMRLFAPESLKGKAAKKWFNKVFWACHDRNRMCECNPDRIFPTF